jgi:hypothetical protein
VLSRAISRAAAIPSTSRNVDAGTAAGRQGAAILRVRPTVRAATARNLDASTDENRRCFRHDFALRKRARASRPPRPAAPVPSRNGSFK